MDTLLTLADWRRAYRDGASPAVLLGQRLRAVRAQGGPAWITLATEAQLQAQLDALQALAAAHHDRESLLAALPLFGVPFAAKDNIDIAGVPTTAACPAYAYTPEHSAVAVQRLQRAGAVWLGKTNLDQFATGLVGTRSPYGRPASVFDATRVSGGSSSGSAVAVARGDVAFALGTDTAGSGRVPAGYNQLVGLKPTPGRVATTGVLPACRSLDCVSVFALDVADAAEVLACIEGPDEGDAYSRAVAGRGAWPAALRIGVPAAPHFSGDAGYAPAFEAAQKEAQQQGHTLVPLDFEPLHAVARLLYDGPWVAERHAVVEALLAQDPQALDPAVRQVIEGAVGRSATEAFRGQYALQEARQALQPLWRDVDVLMVPTAPGHPRFSEVDAAPLAANAELGRYTNFVNLLGWCALALPAGRTSPGLPFGVTFIAEGGDDVALLRFGQQWQQQLALPMGASDRVPQAREPVQWPRQWPTLPIVVVGAHLSGLPLNSQLTERGGRLRTATRTAPHYRLYALPGTVPPKPGLQRVAEGGAAIEVEVWDLPQAAIGSLLALIPPPLGLGAIALADGTHAHGFLCEAHALVHARDITAHGGWRAYLAALKQEPPTP